MMTGAPKFVTMRLGKDSVADIKRIDACEGGIQDPPIFLSVTCKQVPRELKAGTFVLLWLGSDNSKGIKTAWKQGVRAVARIEEVKLGEKHNDDSVTIVSIGYAFPMSMDKIDLLEANPEAYVHFSDLPLVGLSEYANQTIRKVEYGKRSDMGPYSSLAVLQLTARSKTCLLFTLTLGNWLRIASFPRREGCQSLPQSESPTISSTSARRALASPTA